MKTLRDLKNIKGKRILVRVDYNVPMKEKKILDTRRIDASFATIDALQKKGAQVILLAHRGDENASLRPVATYLSKKYKTVFITESLFHTEKIIGLFETVSLDTVILCENIRQYEGEEKNDPLFIKALSQLADGYVNDAFSVSHRKHASVVGITKKLPSYAGVQLEREVQELSKLFENKKHPFLFILGGAKFSTKIPLLKRFIQTADQVVVAGAILNSFYKAAGFEVGASVVEDGYEKEIKAILRSPKLLLPVDVVALSGKKQRTVSVDALQKNDTIVDIGPQSIALIGAKIEKAKIIVWNGPTGWYEKGFSKGTIGLAKAMKESKAYCVIGGGDTGAVVEHAAGEHKKIFISTGGGATLEYLAKGTLPGIACLKS